MQSTYILVFPIIHASMAASKTQRLLKKEEYEETISPQSFEEMGVNLKVIKPSKGLKPQNVVDEKQFQSQFFPTVKKWLSSGRPENLVAEHSLGQSIGEPMSGETVRDRIVDRLVGRLTIGSRGSVILPSDAESEWISFGFLLRLAKYGEEEHGYPMQKTFKGLEELSKNAFMHGCRGYEPGHDVIVDWDFENKDDFNPKSLFRGDIFNGLIMRRQKAVLSVTDDNPVKLGPGGFDIQKTLSDVKRLTHDPEQLAERIMSAATDGIEGSEKGIQHSGLGLYWVSEVADANLFQKVTRPDGKTGTRASVVYYKK